MRGDDAELNAGLRALAGRVGPGASGDCPAPERWLELALGRLEAAAAERLRAHLEVCPACAETARDALAFAAAMAGPAPVARPWPARRWLVLAAAAGLAMVALALWLGRALAPSGAPELARWSSGPLEPPRLSAPALDDELLFRGGGAPHASERELLREGFALLAAGRAAEARAPLRGAAAAADAELAGEASWYLALAELRSGDRAAARRALAPLLAGGGRRAADAAALGRALDEAR